MDSAPFRGNQARLLAFDSLDRAHAVPALAAGAEPVQLIAGKTAIVAAVMRATGNQLIDQVFQQKQIFPGAALGAVDAWLGTAAVLWFLAALGIVAAIRSLSLPAVSD